ncbi:ribosomal-processing cysteine protease Prp [Escherichia coli]|nr:ribosomal-processing cysteine protease Prp [Escherichia coli]
MTKIEVVVGEEGYMSIKAEGHTERVVCASVSTLLQSSVRYLQELSLQYPEALQVIIKEENNEIS